MLNDNKQFVYVNYMFKSLVVLQNQRLLINAKNGFRKLYVMSYIAKHVCLKRTY